MEDNRKEQWKSLFTFLALSGLSGWVALSGAYDGDRWQYALARFLSPFALLFFVFGTLFFAAALSGRWTKEEEKENEGRWLGCLLGVPALIALALLLLVGVIWLIKTIWYAV